MLHKVFYTIFIVSFILDILIRNTERIEDPSRIISKTTQDDLIPSESSNNTNDAEKEENAVNTNQASSLKIKQGDQDLKIKLEGEKEAYTGEKIVISIQYCGGSNYIKNYETLRKQLLESYQNVEVYGAEYPLPFIKKILSKVVWFVQMLLIVLIVGGENVKPYLTFIPDNVFTFIKEKKWMLGIFSFFVGGQLSSAVGSTGAFEVYCNDALIWSKLQRNALPSIEQLANLIKDFGYELV